jgi:hypothetical protein
MSNRAAAAPNDPTKTVYDFLVVNHIDLARDPANRWKILVAKEKEQMANQESGTPPAAAPLGGQMPGESMQMLTQILQLLQSLQGQNALAVQKEKQGLGEITFARGANYAQKGEIVVMKQAGRLSTAALAALEAAAKPVLRENEEVTLTFKPGASVEPVESGVTAGELAVQKETLGKLGALAPALEKVVAAFQGDDSVQNRLAAITGALSVKKSNQTSTEPPARQEQDGGATELDVEGDPEGALTSMGLGHLVTGKKGQ